MGGHWMTPDWSPSWGTKVIVFLGDIEITVSLVTMAENGTAGVEFSATNRMQVGTFMSR